MKAVCWMGKSKVETLTVADPQLLNPHDAIIKITRTAICGSDLHLYDGFIPTMESGDILGHEFMGIVEEVGKECHQSAARRPGRCAVHHRLRQLSVLQEKDLGRVRQQQSERAHLMEAAYGYSGSGLFGYSHMMGGYAGGQAQYARVPFANVGPLKIESDLPDEKVLVSFRHLPDRIYGGRKCADSAGRYCCCLGMWTCRAVRDRQCVYARGGKSHCD